MNMHTEYNNLFPSVVKNQDIDVAMNDLWMEIGKPYETPDGIYHDSRDFEFVNPFLDQSWENNNKTADNIVDVCCTTEYLHFFTKYILNIDLLPYQCAILRMLWTKPLPILLATRGGGKSYLLAVYLTLRACLNQGCRICVVGAALRQSMVLFNYLVKIWEDAPILRDICGGSHNEPKRDQHACHWNCGKSHVAFLPLGTGEKIRGQRANVIIADEFQSLPAPIFETVVRGFASVKSQAVHHNVKTAYKKNILNHLGFDKAQEFDKLSDNYNKEVKEGEEVNNDLKDNQIILSGTASYEFNHFYRYYSFYKAIITTGGDKHELKRQFPEMQTLEEGMDPSDYAIMRIPYDAIPPGMMDEKILSQGRATMDPMIFDQEYGCVFSSDSKGFYLASSIHASTCPIYESETDDEGLIFGPKVLGANDKAYVLSIDPASEDDNFALMIMELQEDGTRHVVYLWTTNRDSFEEMKRRNEVRPEIHDYNTFCIKHIRGLCRRFNVIQIVCDTGGGGLTIREGLRDPAKFLDDSDELIFDMDDVHVANEKGLHKLKMIEFSDAKWRRDSHYALRTDIQNRKVVFPYYDIASMAVDAYYSQEFLGPNIEDKKEDIYLEIEQCKQETAMIKHTMTQGGTERWDVPKIMGLDAEMMKKQLKRDRFTALLLGNWGCRLIQEDEDRPKISDFTGGTAQDLNRIKNTETFVAPSKQNASRNGHNRNIFY